MKVMLLAYEAPEDFSLRDNQEKFAEYIGQWYAFSKELRECGAFDSGAALERPHTATVVSAHGGKRKVEDGPYVDTKEQLGGFFILDVRDMKHAAELAARCPAARRGFVDVRPVPYLEARGM